MRISPGAHALDVRHYRALGRVGQLSNPILFRLRDAALKAVPVRVQHRQFDRMMYYEERPMVR